MKYRRELVMQHLKNAFPDKDESSRRSIARKFYRRLCDYVVETLKLFSISDKELKKRMECHGREHLQAYQEKGQSVICLASHQFNWEWLLARLSDYSPLPIHFVYQPQNNDFVDKVLLHCRTRFGAVPVKRKEVGKEMIKNRNILRMLTIVADQYPGYTKDKKYWTNFLNQSTAFFYGVNQMASITQYPTFYLTICRVKRGYYRSDFIPLSKPPYVKEKEKVIASYCTAAEKIIRKDPSGWLWSHRRWKKQ